MDWALDHARRGIPVFPLHGIGKNGRCTCAGKCSSPGKHPRTKNGVKDATTDEEQIRQWWGRWRTANIGGAMGDLVCLDVDPRSGGHESLSKLEAERGRLPRAAVVKTGRYGEQRGEHLYYRSNGTRFKNARTALPGIEIKANGGYTVLPGSRHESGVTYEWEGAPQFEDAPPQVAEIASVASDEPDDRGDDRDRTGLPVGKRALRALAHGLPEPDDGQTQREVAVGIARNFYEAGRTAEEVRALVARILEHDDSTLDANRPWTAKDVEEIVASVVRDAAPDAGGHRSSPGRDVEKELQRLRVREEARRQFRAEQLGDRFSFPEAGWTLEDELKLPAQETVYRIEGWQTIGGNVLSVASYKAGKTVLTMNLARSLADGEPFLGRFTVEPVDGRIGVFNYELTREMWNRWADELGIANPDRIVVAHLRGAGITPIWDPNYQDRLVEWMTANEIRYWIIDPTAMAWQGLIEGEGDNIGAAEFTAAIDAVKQRAGIPEALLTHHTGRYEQREDEERARGATRLEDWMDAGWYLTKDKEQRFLRANGRDVEQEPLALSYDEETRRISATGLTKEQARDQRGAETVVDAMVELEQRGVERPGTEALKQAMKGDHNRKGAAIEAAERARFLKRERDGRTRVCSLTQMGRRNHEKRHRSKR